MKRFSLILTLSITTFYSAASWGEAGGWKFGLGASYSLTSKLTFSSVTVTDPNTNVTFAATTEIEYKNVPSFELDVRNNPQNSWGFLGGLTYDLSRDQGKTTVKVGDIISSSSGGGNIQMAILYASAVYRWNSFYLPFGFNYNSINSSGNGPSGLKGGVGAQVGVGYYFNDNAVVEVMSRATAVKADPQTSNDGTLVKLGSGYLSNLMLTFKYLL